MKNIKHKTNKQWIKEWYILGLCLVGSIVLIFLSQRFLSGFAGFAAAWVLYVATFVELMVFLARTLGVIMIFAFPEIKALDIRFDHDNINLILENGAVDSYPWAGIQSVILTENADGIYIRSSQKTQSYGLPLTYKMVEEKLDAAIAENGVIGLNKDKQWIESNQSGLNPDKDPTGVKRTYTEYHNRRSMTRVVEAGQGVETITYSRNASLPSQSLA